MKRNQVTLKRLRQVSIHWLLAQMNDVLLIRVGIVIVVVIIMIFFLRKSLLRLVSCKSVKRNIECDMRTQMEDA